MFQSVLFIFNTEKVFHEVEARRKKEEARRAPKVEVKFNESKEGESKPNPESNGKHPRMLEGAIKLPMPMSTPIPRKPQKKEEVSAEARLKEMEKNQQEKEKKFLEEMMKKRSSKMVAFRQSRMVNNFGLSKAPEGEIDFLKGI